MNGWPLASTREWARSGGRLSCALAAHGALDIVRKSVQQRRAILRVRHPAQPRRFVHIIEIVQASARARSHKRGHRKARNSFERTFDRIDVGEAPRNHAARLA